MSTFMPNRGLRIDDETYLKLKVIAKREQRSTNNLTILVLKRFVEEYEMKNGKIDIESEDLT